MFLAFKIVFDESLVDKRPYFFVVRLLAALRLILFPTQMTRYIHLGVLQKLHSKSRRHDPLYFLVHAFYLSKLLKTRDRIKCAIYHHKWEFDKFGSAYEDAVYRGDGVMLWSHQVGTDVCSIRLAASDNNRHEGDLSVMLSIGDKTLWRMAFSYIDGAVFGGSPGPTLLISRNQSESKTDRNLFQKCFKRKSPQFFCLAALCGIAKANGFQSLLAIKHDSQVSYNEAYETGFYNSYTSLWKNFEWRLICREAFELSVPLGLRPPEPLERSQPERPRDHRGYWDEIEQSACTALCDFRWPASP